MSILVILDKVHAALLVEGTAKALTLGMDQRFAFWFYLSSVRCTGAERGCMISYIFNVFQDNYLIIFFFLKLSSGNETKQLGFIPIIIEISQLCEMCIFVKKFIRRNALLCVCAGMQQL